MPIEIGTRVIKMSDIQSSTILKHRGSVDLPYAPIYQWGYGRMDASTPAQGLATSGVVSCIVVVLHSPTTGRTAVTHSPNFMFMTTFLPIVDWIIGGDGKTDWSKFDRMAWSSGAGTKTPGVVVDAVVLRGYDYESERAAKYGHDGWMSDFRQFLASASAARSFRVASCLDAPEVLKFGAVLVDKITARISYLTVEGPNSSSMMEIVDIENRRLVGQYTSAQKMQDLFIGNVLNERIPSDPTELHLQYAVSSYGRAMPLPDEVRQLLRIVPPNAAAQSLLLRTLKVSNDWIASPSGGPGQGMTRTLLETTLAAGRPCELCGDEGHLKCTACKGAWYCGKKHQHDDWKAHKAWCKLHPVPAK